LKWPVARYYCCKTRQKYQRARPELVGITRDINSGKKADTAITRFAGSSCIQASGLAAKTDGLPLGLIAVRFWTHKKVT
jgi:hypothetical protein